MAVREATFCDAGGMINKVNASAWRKEGWRGSASGKMAQGGRPPAFSALSAGAIQENPLEAQVLGVVCSLSSLMCSPPNSFRVSFRVCVCVWRNRDGKEARRNRGMCFFCPEV